MKNLFLANACIMFCFLMSCNQSGSMSGSGNSQAETNKATTEKVHRAIETGDVSTLTSDMVDSNFVDHEAGPNGTDIKGADAAKKGLADIHNHFTDLKIESIANATDGDYNFDLNRTTGTTKDASMGMPANSKFDMISVDVVKYKDGKATDHWSYADPKDIMKMMQGMKTDTTKMAQ